MRIHQAKIASKYTKAPDDSFWVPPSWPKMDLNPKKILKIDLKSIFNHEGCTKKSRATAQNKAI